VVVVASSGADAALESGEVVAGPPSNGVQAAVAATRRAIDAVAPVRRRLRARGSVTGVCPFGRGVVRDLVW